MVKERKVKNKNKDKDVATTTDAKGGPATAERNTAAWLENENHDYPPDPETLEVIVEVDESTENAPLTSPVAKDENKKLEKHRKRRRKTRADQSDQPRGSIKSSRSRKLVPSSKTPESVIEDVLTEHPIFDIPAPRKIPPRKKSLMAKTLKFLFSEIGLILVVVIYIVGGGLMMQNNQTLMVKRIERIKEMVVTEHDDVIGIPRLWAMKKFKQLLDEHQQRIIYAIKKGYDGTVHKRENESYGWSTSSSILFTASTLTTIGYGHVAPKTEFGKLVVVIYSVIALPVLSIFLIKVGGAIGRLIRIMYNKLICRPFAMKRDKQLVYSIVEHEPDWSDDNIMIKWRKQVYVNVVGRHDYWRATPPAAFVVLFVLLYLFSGAMFFTLFEDRWSIINSVYCWLGHFITMLTVGFGDLVPGVSGGSSLGGQLMLTGSSIYIVVGLAVMAMGIDIMGEAVGKLRYELETHDLVDTIHKQPSRPKTNEKKQN